MGPWPRDILMLPPIDGHRRAGRAVEAQPSLSHVSGKCAASHLEQSDSPTSPLLCRPSSSL